MKNISEYLALPVADRLRLVEAIWESLVETPEAIPVTSTMREELDHRWLDYSEDRESARPWRGVREELFGAK